ncbi:kelch repeat-containing protein [Variovorax sp. M-6]|uniref:Kelch repeat-containing protein n=1 Tax=Variovorax sp. M-6 TaxID=3233041 RepID=UPI003F997FFC
MDPPSVPPAEPVSPPQGLRFASASVTYVAGMLITPNTPTYSGGTITRYVIAPALPTGLELDPASGVISGAPQAPSTQVLYTVTGSNASGSATAGVRIEVTPRAIAPTNLHYLSEAPIYRLEQAIVPNTPVADGGAFTQVSLSPALPTGLVLNKVTGVISGTPTQLSPSRNYTITASNSAGSSSVILRISVEALPSPPTALGYRTPSAMYNLGKPITPNLPASVGGPVKSYSVVPELPAGLSLDTTNGAISGTPRGLQSSTRYIITGRNEAGSASATVHIAVVTGAMSTNRVAFGLALLTDGRALAVGGGDSSFDPPLSSAEFFDVTTGQWMATGSMSTVRGIHSLTLLSDGRVLAAGGTESSALAAHETNTAELYEPATGQWSTTGSMNVGRYGHTATLLSNGKLLVAGGTSFRSTITSAELFDPATGQWVPTGSLNVGRTFHYATLLANGKVLVFGGADSTISELYDPVAGTWAVTGSTLENRSLATATLLPNGQVLAVGGYIYSGLSTPRNSTELYDPSTGVWAAAGAMSVSRWGHTSTLIPGGKVLVAGGTSDGGTTDLGSTEIYDVTTNRWSTSLPLSEPRRVHRSVALLDGRVLLVGGAGPNGPLSSSEVYAPFR